MVRINKADFSWSYRATNDIAKKPNIGILAEKARDNALSLNQLKHLMLHLQESIGSFSPVERNAIRSYVLEAVTDEKATFLTSYSEEMQAIARDGLILLTGAEQALKPASLPQQPIIAPPPTVTPSPQIAQPAAAPTPPQPKPVPAAPPAPAGIEKGDEVFSGLKPLSTVGFKQGIFDPAAVYRIDLNLLRMLGSQHRLGAELLGRNGGKENDEMATNISPAEIQQLLPLFKDYFALCGFRIEIIANAMKIGYEVHWPKEDQKYLNFKHPGAGYLFKLFPLGSPAKAKGESQEGQFFLGFDTLRRFRGHPLVDEILRRNPGGTGIPMATNISENEVDQLVPIINSFLITHGEIMEVIALAIMEESERAISHDDLRNRDFRHPGLGFLYKTYPIEENVGQMVQRALVIVRFSAPK